MKLIKYLRSKYCVSQVYYFGGVEVHDYDYDYLNHETVPLEDLEEKMVELIEEEAIGRGEVESSKLINQLARVRFYLKLQDFGYKMFLKPVKMYYQNDGSIQRKANCDVDMAFYLMKEKDNFDKILFLSGDGDFLPVLKHLREIGKEIIVLARGPRTAREIRQFAESNFRDFEYLRELLRM